MVLLDAIFGINPKPRYSYYDTPEGEDCFKKLICVTRRSAEIGSYCALVDNLLYTHPKGLLPTIGRFAFIALPIVGIGAAFVVTTCMATNLRKKDDHWNYFIAGNVVGGLCGAWTKSLKVGCYGGFFIGLFLLVNKHCIDSGYVLYGSPDSKRIYGNHRSVNRDFTILKDPGRTWKISADE